MANYTQKAILQTFDEMLTEMPFDKITVTSLVKRCEISSNTFYYHYRDIYDLLDEWIEQNISKYFNDDPAEWQNSLKCFLYKVKENPYSSYHIMDSVSRERLEKYIFEFSEKWFYNWICNATKEYEVPEKKLQVIADFCCYSLVGFFLKFLWKRTEVDIEQEVDSLGEIFEGSLEYVIKRSVSNSNCDEKEKVEF